MYHFIFFIFFKHFSIKKEESSQPCVHKLAYEGK